MAARRNILVAVGILAAFVVLAIAVLSLGFLEIVKPAVSLLMLVALVGLFIGFGVLIGVYRLIGKLE